MSKAIAACLAAGHPVATVARGIYICPACAGHKWFAQACAACGIRESVAEVHEIAAGRYGACRGTADGRPPAGAFPGL